MIEQINAALYLNYPYRRPIIGWEHEIRALDLDRILAFYKKYYAPNNAVLVVEGDVTLDELKPLAEKYYGVIPSGPDIKRVRTTEPPARADRRVRLEHERVTQESWSRRYLAPSANYGKTELYPALQVLAEILGGGPSSRLHKALVLEEKIALSSAAFYSPNDLGPSAFGVYATLKPDTTMADIERSIMRQVGLLLEKGVSADEVDHTIERLRNNAVFAKDDFGTAARVFGIALTSGGTIEGVENWLNKIEAVTPEAVLAAAKEVLENKHHVTAELVAKPQG